MKPFFHVGEDSKNSKTVTTEETICSDAQPDLPLAISEL
jgi:hypothetical protein